MKKKGKRWARTHRSGAHGLRRGAWYTVVNDALPKIVVLQVRKENIPVPRSQLDLSDEQPAKWSVVQWEEGQRGARRASEANFGMTYLVCPSCGNRVRLEPDVERLTCSECSGEYELDWDNPC